MSDGGDETGGLAGACSAADAQPAEGAEHGAAGCPAPQPSKHCPTDFIVEAPERILRCDGDGVRLRAKDMKGFSGGRFKWETTCPNLDLSASQGRSIHVKGRNNVSSGRDAETVKVTRRSPGCADITKTIKLTVGRLCFSQSDFNKYGYDDYDLVLPWKGHGSQLHHMSVMKDGLTRVHVAIEGGLVGSDFDFVCKHGPRRPCVPSGGDNGWSDFELNITGGDRQKKPQILEARTKTGGKSLFGELAIPVYAERTVDVVVGKFDDPLVLPLFGIKMYSLVHPYQDYSVHTPAVNDKMREGVVKFNIRNLFTDNSVADYKFSSGTQQLTFDIADPDGGPDVRGLRRIMAGRTKTSAVRTRVPNGSVRVAMVPALRSYYYLAGSVKKGATKVRVRGSDEPFFNAGDTAPIGSGATVETMNIVSVHGTTIKCAPLANDHPAGAPIEFPAAGWSSDPIIIVDNNLDLNVTLWTVPHEASHRAFDFSDLDDTTNVMHFSQGQSDYRVRHSPRPLHYKPGKTEKQWDMMHKG